MTSRPASLVILLLTGLVVGCAAVAGAAKPAAAPRTSGDDCADPVLIPGLPFSDIGQTTCGSGNDYDATCLGYYDGGEDIVYRLDLASPTTVTVTFDPHETLWTGVAIFDGCPDTGTCLVQRSGYDAIPQVISGLELDPGSYFIMVDKWHDPPCLSSFDLIISIPVTYANPICDLAIDLREQGLTSFPVNTCGSLMDYDPVIGCTGWQAAGEDAVWMIHLAAGESFSAALSGEDYDASLYLLTDCTDMNSCVAGGDDPEIIDYQATSAGWYYLIVDGYLLGGCGNSVLTIEAPVAGETATWGGVKQMYR
ncbi:MAG: PPC domain-containing protein [Candidatus Latescibacteria bacterium]|nr:PPC domain-containing protein [Candidatus Latescibacterota bacterium]